MGHRSHAGEAGRLALIEAAEFRHIDEQAQGGGLGNARYAHEDRQSRGEIRILLTQAEKVGLKGSKLVSNLAQRSKARQQGCIEPIGFGELTQGFSEAAGVAGIDLRQRQAGRCEAAFQGAVVSSGASKTTR